MWRALLLFILSPVILFGQARQKAIVDSVKAAATNLQRVSALIANYPGAKVENIEASGSDGYVTMVIRIHVDEAIIIPALSTMPVAKMKTGDIVAGGVSIVNIPPL